MLTSLPAWLSPRLNRRGMNQKYTANSGVPKDGRVPKPKKVNRKKKGKFII